MHFESQTRLNFDQLIPAVCAQAELYDTKSELELLLYIDITTAG